MQPIAFSGVRFPVLALGTVAVALSLALVPRGWELAQLSMEAGDPWRAAAILEAKVTAGDRSPATIAALARARAGTGDATGAAQLLEALVAERPRDPAALRALAEVQRTARRTDGLIRTLERLQEIAPTVPRERELARLYGAAGRSADQLALLRNLVARATAEPNDYLVLAKLEASMGRPLAGVGVLQVLGTRRPQAVDASLVGLELRLMLAGGEAEQALQRADQWLQGRRDLAESGPLLAGSLTTGGRPDLAVTLLERYTGADTDLRLIAALSQAESDAGHPAAGLQRLERLDPTGDAGSKQAALLRLRLALVIGDIDRTMAAAERLGWAVVPDDLLQSVAAAALMAGQAETLQRLAALGEERLAFTPILVARLRLAVGDADGARRWSDRAMATLTGQPELALQVVELELQLERRDRAAALLLGPVLTDPALPPATLPTVARLLIRSGQAGAGVPALAALRRSQPSAAVDEAWALAAAAAGHGDAVAAWLAAPGHAAPAINLLQDLLHLALDAGARGLALTTAERLVTARGSAEESLLLARLLFEAKQPRRALERLRALPPGTAVPEDLHTAVLVGAWRQGAPVAEEMRGLARRRLAAAATPAERDAAIALLLELRAHAEVLPVLRTLAVEAPGRWLWTYSSTAAAAGRPGDAAALMAELALRPGLPAELRRQLAFRLLEAGDKRAAERALRGLAATALPESPDVRQLLFLWGPRPGAEQLAWIEARTLAASGAEQGAWMRILTDRGAPARAIAVYRAGAKHEVPETTIEAYLAALEVQDDRDAIAVGVREELSRAQSTGLWRRLARMAARVGDAALERQAIERLVAAGEGGADAQRRLGVLAHLRREHDTAERLLLSFVATTGGDDESWMILGDIATRRRDHAMARQRYAESLQRLEASRETFRSRVVRAHLLHRLGREAEAARLYEALLAQSPRDQSVRADYVAMLMEQGSLRHAHDVLAGR